MLSMKRMNLKIINYHLKTSFFISCIKKNIVDYNLHF
jgi:hypothetical protein